MWTFLPIKMDMEMESSSYWAAEGDDDQSMNDDDVVELDMDEKSTKLKIDSTEEKNSRRELQKASIKSENDISTNTNRSRRISTETKMDIGSSHHNHNNDHIDSSKVEGHSHSQKDNDTAAVTAIDTGIISETTRTMTSNMIKAIDTNVVHQICSGQVIVTLSTGIKELVENAIDAGATSVDIRLVEYGSELIEVSDNGSGVDEANFQGLAMKHHTSKISEFEDLTSVSTFGFRGEALSSLCALSNLTLITRSKSSEAKNGFRIEYDSKGSIISKTNCAREYGTTVLLKNIFLPLPVRHREFLKNLKREFHKAINVLYGYCLIAEGVRITCTNQIGNSPPSKVISVPASQTMRERIVSLFGSKQLQFLMPFQQEEPNEETLGEFGLSVKTFVKEKYKLEGYISTPNHGRSSNDRQFFFINSRPCDPAKITRIITEVYHTYSRNQSPFVCLNIQTKQENVDINVTPDKRVLYLQSEKSLYALLKASLTSMFVSASSTFNVSQETLSFSQSQSQSDSQSTVEEIGDDRNFSRQFSTHSPQTRNSSPRECKSSSSNSSARSFLRTFALKSSSINSPSSDPSFSSRFSQPFKRIKTLDHHKSSKQSKLFQFMSPSSSQTNHDSDGDLNDSSTLKNDSQDSFLSSQEDNPIEQKSQESCDNNISQISHRIVYDDEIDPWGHLVEKQPVVHTSVDWSELLNKLKDASLMKQDAKQIDYARKFRSRISPENNDAAEQELKKQLTKEMFSQMKIVGQFNLGFILVSFGPDIFIVDQHASDEKYNFEDLQKTTVMQTQRLICPMELQLPAVSENIIMDNLDTFQKNGFDFDINSEGEPTNRVKLTKIPYSKSCEFGKSDMDELIFMMEDAPEKCFCRPSKVRLMLASRACRKSVMIGKALSSNEMTKIVEHMGEMDQPWNCPHGRPTIRHLINMNLLPEIDAIFNHSNSN